MPHSRTCHHASGRVSAALRPRLERRDTLVDVVRATQASLDPQKVAEYLVRWAADWLPVNNWAVVAAEPGRRIGAGRRAGAARGGAPAAQAVAVWVTQTNSDFLSANLSQDTRVSQSFAAAVLAFPLNGRDRILGALVGLDAALPPRTPRFAAGVLEAWRALLEPAVARARECAAAAARRGAVGHRRSDPALQFAVPEPVAAARNQARHRAAVKPLSLLFIDLDGFKSINDTYGHLYGSRALVEAAAVIRGCARETDVVARFGGDEFAVVLPDTGREGAWSVGVAHPRTDCGAPLPVE